MKTIKDYPRLTDNVIDTVNLDILNNNNSDVRHGLVMIPPSIICCQWKCGRHEWETQLLVLKIAPP